MAYTIKDERGRPVEVRGALARGFDTFDAEVKDFSNKERTFLAVANQETPDRFKDVISVKGWNLDNYRKNPVVMSFHLYDQLPVGRSLEEFKRTKGGVKQLMFRPQFAPYPETMRMYEMYRDGYLKGFSVGFLPIESEKIDEGDEDGGMFYRPPTRFTKTELLEVSVAPIPAHPDALSEIKSLVKKGDLYIPARYLREEDEPEVEVYGDYVHIKFADRDEFRKLYEHRVDDLVMVFGKKVGEEETELFIYKLIGPEEHYNEGITEEGRKEVDDYLREIQTGQRSEDPPSLVVYDSKKYESQDAVMVELPEVDEKVFEVSDDGEEELESEEENEVIKEIEEEETEEVDGEAAEGKTYKDVLEELGDECEQLMLLVKEELKGQEEEVEPEEGDVKELDDGSVDIYLEGEWVNCEVVEDKDLPPVEVKPYPNEHACRLNDPGKYDKFARKNCYRKSDGKCVDYIFGISGGKSEVQALRYPKSSWTASAASSHCKGRGGTFEAAGKEMDGKALVELFSKRVYESVKGYFLEKEEDIAELKREVEELKTTLEGLEEFVRSELNRDEDDDGEPVLEIQSEERQVDDNDNDDMLELEDESEEREADDLRAMIDEALRQAVPYALGRLED